MLRLPLSPGEPTGPQVLIEAPGTPIAPAASEVEVLIASRELKALMKLGATGPVALGPEDIFRAYMGWLDLTDEPAHTAKILRALLRLVKAQPQAALLEALRRSTGARSVSDLRQLSDDRWHQLKELLLLTRFHADTAIQRDALRSLADLSTVAPRAEWEIAARFEPCEEGACHIRAALQLGTTRS